MTDPARRRAAQLLFKGIGLLCLAPIRPACAERNAIVRVELKYREDAPGKHHCRACVHFRAGTGSAAAGRCEMIPGDDEIDPNGCCGLWASV